MERGECLKIGGANTPPDIIILIEFLRNAMYPWQFYGQMAGSEGRLR